ncbi:MAG TPA: alpha/beta hydrolase [Bacteroidales bacterium]|nr:alpha/beta hydrolase [Bacteroidales bacterium]
MKKTLLILLLILPAFLSHAQTSNDSIVIFPDGAPGAKGNSPKDIPTLTVFRPDNPNGAAVVICPGGGYVALAIDKEGYKFARWFNERGVTAFVLKYRLDTWDVKGYTYPAQFDDATRAMRLVRSQAGKYGIDPSKIGIMGFSAGGHLASTVGTHFDYGNPDAQDVIERYSSRPDFMILAYPVISMTTPYTHRFSRKVLIGEDLNKDLAWYLSSELQVTTFTPPTFLFHTDADNTVPAENSMLFYQALRKVHVPAEIHIFEHGHHGVGLAKDDPALSVWPLLLENWLKGRGLM